MLGNPVILLSTVLFTPFWRLNSRLLTFLLRVRIYSDHRVGLKWKLYRFITFLIGPLPLLAPKVVKLLKSPSYHRPDIFPTYIFGGLGLYPKIGVPPNLGNLMIHLTRGYMFFKSWI
jgi:hypothetical protein